MPGFRPCLDFTYPVSVFLLSTRGAETGLPSNSNTVTKQRALGGLVVWTLRRATESLADVTFIGPPGKHKNVPPSGTGPPAEHCTRSLFGADGETFAIGHPCKHFCKTEKSPGPRGNISDGGTFFRSVPSGPRGNISGRKAPAEKCCPGGPVKRAARNVAPGARCSFLILFL